MPILDEDFVSQKDSDNEGEQNDDAMVTTNGTNHPTDDEVRQNTVSNKTMIVECRGMGF